MATRSRVSGFLFGSMECLGSRVAVTVHVLVGRQNLALTGSGLGERRTCMRRAARACTRRPGVHAPLLA